MSFETIRIYRDLQIVSDYIQIPPNNEAAKNKVGSEEPGDVVMSPPLSSGSEIITIGRQRIYRLPPINPDTWYEVDPVEELTEVFVTD